MAYTEGYLDFRALYQATHDTVREITNEDDQERRIELSEKLLEYISIYNKQMMRTENFINTFGIYRNYT